MHDIHDSSEAVPESLAATDLNLVVAFDALARELSVTRAAARIGITQSAMSHALRRLRDLLCDPLLVRGGDGMMLTPRGESLVVPFRSALVAIGRALAQPDRFDPAVARRSFSLVSPDLFDVLAVPPLLAQIRDEAPGVDLTVLPLDGQRLADRLETGEVDVAIVPKIEARDFLDAAEPGLVRRTLLRDRFTCLLRAGHPALRRSRKLSLRAYGSLSHAVVSPTGHGRTFVDEILDRHGVTRRIAVRTPHFYSALAIVAKSDLILTAPTALLRLASRDLKVITIPAPFALPEHSINLVWHERFSNDPGHRWLRELVVKLAPVLEGQSAPNRSLSQASATRR